ncbi:MAG: hypothetical protein RL754_129 [Bacteroidota bacterium]|jgi:copper chaperone CopZ
MKSLKILALFLLVSFGAHAQNNVVNTTIEVDGLCGMCKERIENAAYIKGVKQVNWDKETHLLNITYNAQKVSMDEIAASINEAGHDVRGHIATDEQYANIHGCCRYRDEVLRNSHGLGGTPMCKEEQK